MEDSVRKIKTVKSVTFAKQITEPVTLAKNIVYVPIEFISASISIPVKSVYDSFPVEFDLVKSIESVEFVKNSFPFNMISNSLLDLNVFIFEIGKETLNNMELKHGYLEPIKEETYNAGFLRVVNYLEWLANVVSVPKKDGMVRMCVDFRDLNKASPKDDFPLPHIDILVDNTAGHALLSFMDGFSRYNQIKMAPKDMEKTSFITPCGTYCYKVMSFGLKNAGATY